MQKCTHACKGSKCIIGYQRNDCSGVKTNLRGRSILKSGREGGGQAIFMQENGMTGTTVVWKTPESRGGLGALWCILTAFDIWIEPCSDAWDKLLKMQRCRGSLEKCVCVCVCGGGAKTAPPCPLLLPHCRSEDTEPFVMWVSGEWTYYMHGQLIPWTDYFDRLHAAFYTNAKMYVCKGSKCVIGYCRKDCLGVNTNQWVMYTVKRKLSFQQAICYMSFRQVNILHAWTVNSVNRLLKIPKHIQAIWFSSKPNIFPRHLWCR